MSYLSEAEEAQEKAWEEAWKAWEAWEAREAWEAWEKARKEAWEAWVKARKEAWEAQEARDKAKQDCCPECGELWNSEYHMSDQCVSHNEDKEVKNEL